MIVVAVRENDILVGKGKMSDFLKAVRTDMNHRLQNRLFIAFKRVGLYIDSLPEMGIDFLQGPVRNQSREDGWQ